MHTFCQVALNFLENTACFKQKHTGFFFLINRLNTLNVCFVLIQVNTKLELYPCSHVIAPDYIEHFI